MSISSSYVSMTPTVLEIPSKPVKDILAADGNNVPEIFTRESGNHCLDAADPSSALPWKDCPIIDLSRLFSPVSSSSSCASLTKAQEEQELEKLHSALLSWGCFQLINHGMEESLLDEIEEVNKEFFALPFEERKKYLRRADEAEGYGNESILSQNVPHNWNDRMFYYVYPEHERNIARWPLTPIGFRKMVDEYTMKVKEVHEIVVKAMAKCIGLEDENGFLAEYGESVRMAVRINYYPKCPLPQLVRAARAHSDGSVITFLLQDKHVEGLQILKDHTWFKVPIIPYAIFVNVGDQMEIMSNGLFKSAVHRVVANSERERHSTAMFFVPYKEKEIAPLKMLLSHNHPPIYKPIKNYENLFFQYHAKGERLISRVKHEMD